MLINDEKSFQKFQDSLQKLERSLDRSNTVRDGMVHILSRFESKMQAIEEQMMDMNGRVDKLKLAHDNIDTTIKSIERVLDKFNVPIAVERRIEEGVNGDIGSFLKCLDRINDAASFFAKHMNFKGADRLALQLNALKQKSISGLETEFKRISHMVSKRELDPFTLQRPGGTFADFEMVPQTSVEELNRIAKRLDSMNAIGYRKIWKDIRIKFIRNCLERVYPERGGRDRRGKKHDTTVTSAARGGGGGGSSALSRDESHITLRGDTAAMDMSPDSVLHRYNKGSHKFIFFMNFYLRLLEAEKDVTQRVISGPETSYIFGEVITPSMNLFIERAMTLADPKSQSQDKIFVLIDVLQNFETKLMKNFDQVLAQNTRLGEGLQHLLTTLKEGVSKMLEEKKVEIESNTTTAFREGLVHEMTSNAFIFLRRLLDYRELVEELLRTYFFADDKKESRDYNSYIGRYIKFILGAIEQNIELKARTYKSQSLQSIFTLNNHHHILKRLQSQEMKRELGDAVINSFEYKVKNDQDAYLVVTWGSAIECLTARDIAKKIVKKGNEYTKSSKNEIKNRLKQFNQAFMEVHTKHRSYSIPDIELRETMRARTVETVVPAWQAFVDKYCKNTNFSRHPHKYLQYDAHTMEDILCQLFDEQGEPG